MFYEGQANSTGADDADSHFVEAFLALVPEKAYLAIIEAVRCDAPGDRVGMDDSAIATNDDGAVERHLEVPTKPDRARDSPASQDESSNRGAASDRQQGRVVPAMGITVDRRERDRVFPTMIVDGKIDECVFSRLVNEGHRERSFQLPVAAIAFYEVSSVLSKNHIPNEQANFISGLDGTCQDRSTMLIAIAWEQVCVQPVVVWLRQHKGPRFGGTQATSWSHR